MNKKAKGISKYLKLDYRTFQGKLTRLFMVVAVMMLIILLGFSHLYHSQHQEQQYIAETLAPSLQKVQALGNLLEVGQLSEPKVQQKLYQLLEELNQLSNGWEGEHFLFYHQQLIDHSETLRVLAQEKSNWKESEAFNSLKKNLLHLEQALQKKYNAIAEDHRETAENMPVYLWLSFLVYFSCGVYIAHLVIKVMVKKIIDLRNTIRSLAVGILPDQIQQIPDEFYSTRAELIILSKNLKSLTHFSKEVGQGNFDTAIDAFDQEGALGKSLAEMRDSLKKVSDEQINRRWFNEGISQFAEILRKNNTDIEALSREIISPLIKYLGAIQGALFVQEDDINGQSYLKMRACYAYDRLKYLDRKVPAGNGLIGQAYLEREQIYLKEIPEDYESITTGLGQGKVKSLLLLPLIDNNTVEGVLEIASQYELAPHQLEFLEKVAESIAAAIGNVKNNEKTQQLLYEAQSAAEQMGAQEEEMRQNMEEMQATQEEMERAQKELLHKETNLNAFINNTTDSIITITRDYKVGLINDTLKARYKGTPYEGISSGKDVLPTLGEVADEWKTYYDRAFKGEHLDFTIKSSVKGEESWRQYTINPIKTNSEEIIGASVISRDISEKVLNEQKLKKKNAVLNAIIAQPANAHLALDEKLQVLVMSPQLKKYLPELEESLQEGNQFLSHLSSAEAQEWNANLQKAWAGEAFTLNRITKKEKKPLQLHFLPLKGENQEKLAVLVSIRENL